MPKDYSNFNKLLEIPGFIVARKHVSSWLAGLVSCQATARKLSSAYRQPTDGRGRPKYHLMLEPRARV